MYKIKFLYFLILFSFWSSDNNAQSQFSPSNSRALSMGNAFTAISGDENSIYYNPAGLIQTKGRKLSFNIFLQNYSIMNSVIRVKQNNLQLNGTIFFVQDKFGVVAGIWERGDRKEHKRLFVEDIAYEKRLFYERFISIAFAKKITSDLSFGIKGTYLNSATDSKLEKLNFLFNHTNAFSVSLGLLYEPSKRFKLGGTIQNLLSTKLKYYLFDDFGKHQATEGLPQNLNIGICYLPSKSLIVSADVKNLIEDKVHTVDDNYEVKRTYHLGCEYRIYPNLALRLGLMRQNYPRNFDSRLERPAKGGWFRRRFEYKANYVLTLGIGIKSRNLSLDLATAIDNRKREIEDTRVELGSLEVEGSTLRYLLSVSYQF